MKVIVHAAHPVPLAAQLQAAHPDVTIATCASYDGLADLLTQQKPDAVYSIRFAGTDGFPTRALLGRHGPKWIAVGGSGVDHLGIWNPARTTVTNSAGVAAQMMAEYVFGSFLHFSLDVPGLEQDRKERRWTSRMMSPMQGRTLLIVGLGHTGRAIARLAKAFGMRVIGTRANPRPMDDVDAVHSPEQLHGLCAQADYIAICTPLLDSTRGLFDKDMFGAIRQGAVLVDVSRGGIVQARAVRDALTSGKLKGAALDVFEREPLPADSCYWDLPNLLISPHCSSVFAEWDSASMALFCRNLDRWKSGEPLLNVVDPHRGY